MIIIRPIRKVIERVVDQHVILRDTGVIPKEISMYTFEYDDERLVWVVIKWEASINGTRVGTTVFKDTSQANAAAMCEEMQYDAMCHEWALNNNQESEFDYV